MQSILRGLARIIDTISTWVARVASVCVLLLILIGALTALLTKVGEWTGHRLVSNAFLDAQWYLYGIAFLFFAAHNLKADQHVRVDVLYDRYPRRAQHALNLLGTLLLLLPMVLVILGYSSDAARLKFMNEGASDAGGIPRWPMRVLIPAAFALLALQAMAQLVRHGLGLFASAEPAASEAEGRGSA